MDPSPSEARARSLADHQALRRAADRLRAQVSGCGCTALPHHTGRAIAALLDRVRDQLDREDAELGPVLQHLDPWGSVRAAQLQEHRTTELSRLGEMLARLADPLADGPLRLHVLRFVDWLDGELGAEEQAELDEHLLRDDPIVDDTKPG